MFAPDKEITRQEMFTLLYNSLKLIGQFPSAKTTKSLTEFSDVAQIAPWAKDAMVLLVESGIINGDGQKLHPLDTTARAEMTQVLYNLLVK